jgi:parvulin-like peptidyl-prolyl isomerase
VLKDYWGWSVDDFKRSLREELLAQKVAAKLDTATQARASAALAELKGGADFAAVAKKYSDDQGTKDNGGEFGYPVDRTARDLTAQTTDALFKLKPGQYSDIVNIGYGLEIVKNIETNGDKIRGAHIVFNFKDITTYINDLKDKQKTRVYISLPSSASTSPPAKGNQ